MDSETAAGLWLLAGILLGLISLIAGCIVFIIYSYRKRTENPFVNFKKHLLVYGSIFAVSIIIFGIGAYKISTPSLDDSAPTADSYDSLADSSDSDSSDVASTTPDTPISKTQYQKIEVGIAESQLKKIVPNMDSNNIADDGTTADWMFINDDGGNADIYVDDSSHKVSKKEEQGILSENSDTTTTAFKTIDNRLNDEVTSAVTDTIGSTVKWGDKSKKAIRKYEINDNLGKNDGSKLALLYLNSPAQLLDGPTTTKDVNKDTLKIANKIKSISGVKLNSITFFWFVPLTSGESEGYKIDLEKDTISAIGSSTTGDELPDIADQYNVLYNDK